MKLFFNQSTFSSSKEITFIFKCSLQAVDGYKNRLKLCILINHF